MGALTLPTSGQVYADTQSIIYSVETLSPYWPLLLPLWQSAQTSSFQVVTSDLALMETLVGPMKRGDQQLTAAYEALFKSPELLPLPITQDILREAARLRATIPALKTPDSIHAATALMSGCALFVTNDMGFRRVPNLPLVLLDDVLQSP